MGKIFFGLLVLALLCGCIDQETKTTEGTGKSEQTATTLILTTTTEGVTPPSVPATTSTTTIVTATTATLPTTTASTTTTTVVKKNQAFDPASYGKPNPKNIQQNIPPCCNHPYWHTIYRAYSSDLVNWKKDETFKLEHASVPDILKKDDGFILYYVNGQIDTADCSISSDGKAFSYGDCRIYNFTEEKAWDPDVIRLDDGRYRMYFFAPNLGNRNNRIMSAISDDGINWLQEEGVRFQYPNILDPSVIKIGESYFMYAWFGERPEDNTIIIAKSSDGLTFTEEKELKLGGGIPDIRKIGDREYGMFFCKDGGISMATSEDGLTWGSVRSIFKQACDPTVEKSDDGRWVMYYKQLAPPK